METFWQDLKYGVRMLARSPSFTAIAILTLALGIGANTVLFSVVNGVLLKPLPYLQPDSLVSLAESTAEFESSSISYPNFLDWQRANSTFSSIAAYRGDDFTITGQGETERVRVGMVSSTFFPILGVKMVAGRSFLPEEDRLGAAPVVLISAGLWHRKFGSDPGIVGKTFEMNDKVHTVVGVLPPVPQYPNENDVYMATSACPFRSNKMHLEDRDMRMMEVFGRVKPGVTVAQANADISTIAAGLKAAYPKSHTLSK